MKAHFCLLFLAYAGISFLQAQQTPTTSLLVLNKRDLTMAIVDPSTREVVGRVPSGIDPHEVIASEDGRYAYITNYNPSGAPGTHTISVVDLIAQKALPPIRLGTLTAPHGADVAGGKLYFTAEGNKVVGRYDPATQQIDMILGTGQDRTHMVLLTKDLNRMYTTNVASGTLSVIDRRPNGPPQTTWVVTNVAVGRGAEGFDLSPDGKEVWTANAQDGSLSIVDPETKKVTQTVSGEFTRANRLKFTPNGKFIFVSDLRGTDLIVVDVPSRKEVKRLPLGGGAAGIQMDPTSPRAYVAVTPMNYVAIIDTTKLEVIGRLETGGNPDGMAWAVRK